MSTVLLLLALHADPDPLTGGAEAQLTTEASLYTVFAVESASEALEEREEDHDSPTQR